MHCYACNELLTEHEELLNSREDFINNTCLCAECLSASNDEANSIDWDDYEEEEK